MKRFRKADSEDANGKQTGRSAQATVRGQFPALALIGTILAAMLFSFSVFKGADQLGSPDSILHGYRAQCEQKADCQALHNYLQHRCQAKDGDACAELGERDGTNKVKLAMFEEACKLGSTSGCNQLALLYENGRDAAPGGEDQAIYVDLPLAAQYYGLACREGRGDGEGCNNLGGLYKKGQVGSPDPNLAAALYQMSCNLGYGLGCVNYGVMHDKGQGGVAQDEEKAKEAYHKGCEGRIALGCYNLAHMYEAEHDERAQEFYKKACTYGSESGCMAVAEQQASLNTTTGFEAAAESYHEACRVGKLFDNSHKGCVREAALYLWHNIVPKTGEQPVELLKRACAANEANGCYDLALVHYYGMAGSDKNPAQAEQFFGRACTLGMKDACRYSGSHAHARK